MSTAQRVLEVFEAFAHLQKPLTLSQLSEAVGVPVSSCFSIVRTLEERGYLHCVSSRKEWYPTGRIAINARAIEKGEPLLNRCEPVLAALREQTNETVILGQAASSGSSILYLMVFEGRQAIRYSSEIGARKPVHSTAIGKALLSNMDVSQRNRALRSLNYKKVTDRTFEDSDALLKDIDAGVARGYQMTVGENVVDVGAFAIPVTLLGRDFGVAVAGPVDRLKLRKNEITAALLEARNKLTTILS